MIKGNIGLSKLSPKPMGESKSTQVMDKDAFKNALSNATNITKGGIEAKELGVEKGQLKFSAHAVDRMRARGLNFTPTQMDSLEKAVMQAKSKGAKDTLVLSDNAAMIVSVNNNTVVTVMGKEALKDNLFTKIDSTILI